MTDRTSLDVMAPHLLLAYNFPPMSGGIARVQAELALRYPPGTLVVSTGPDAGSEAVDRQMPNRVDRLTMRRERLRTIPGLVAWSRRALTLTRETKASFIWCGNIKPPGYAAYYTHRRTDVPYGVILYGTDLLQLRGHVRTWGYKRFLACRLLGCASVLVAISRWTRSLTLEVLAEAGCNPDQHDVRTVLLGTDPDQFHPGIETAAVRAKYGLDDGQWMLTVARYFPHKGQDVTIRALATLVTTEPRLRYALVGWGAFRAKLEALAAELGVADRVRFLENVPDADLPALYNLAELYVGPSRNEGVHAEGFGISFVEASACGIPVVAGRSGGVPDAVREGETGLLVDGESADAVAGAIARLLRDRAFAARLGAGGRRAVEEFFNWDRVAREMRSIGEEYARARANRYSVRSATRVRPLRI